jgi:hypothetical protein
MKHSRRLLCHSRATPLAHVPLSAARHVANYSLILNVPNSPDLRGLEEGYALCTGLERSPCICSISLSR